MQESHVRACTRDIMSAGKMWRPDSADLLPSEEVTAELEVLEAIYGADFASEMAVDAVSCTLVRAMNACDTWNRWAHDSSLLHAKPCPTPLPNTRTALQWCWPRTSRSLCTPSALPWVACCLCPLHPLISLHPLDRHRLSAPAAGTRCACGCLSQGTRVQHDLSPVWNSLAGGVYPIHVGPLPTRTSPPMWPGWRQGSPPCMPLQLGVREALDCGMVLYSPRCITPANRCVCYVLLHVCGRGTCLFTCRLQSIAAPRACNQLFHMLHQRVCCTLHIWAVTVQT